MPRACQIPPLPWGAVRARMEQRQQGCSLMELPRERQKGGWALPAGTVWSGPRGGGEALSPAPPQPPPARALPENDHILLVSFAGIGLSGGHLLRSAHFPISVSSDASTLRPSHLGPHFFLVQRQHRGRVFPPHGGFLTLSKSHNHKQGPIRQSVLRASVHNAECGPGSGSPAIPPASPACTADGQLAPWPALCS